MLLLAVSLMVQGQAAASCLLACWQAAHHVPRATSVLLCPPLAAKSSWPVMSQNTSSHMISLSSFVSASVALRKHENSSDQILLTTTGAAK
jgi:hypothetical protein